MKLVTYEAGGQVRTGVLTDAGVLDSGFATMRELLGAGPPAQPRGEPVQPERLLPPVTDPEKIVCIGLNYLSHAQEQGAEPPNTPTLFAKYRNALAAPDSQVKLPSYSSKVDYEAEIAFAIGTRAKDVAEADALDHVAGYMLLNDLSARDMQFATPQWMPGKIFDGAAPCGPWLVTPDEAGAHDAIGIRLTLNGEEMQSGSTADLVHSIPALVVYLSKLMTLEPGDVISTGTPAGVGSLRSPRVWLKPGDEIVVESPTLGRLATTLA
ncbi:MAG TPA: fumarylacetoacetate hydrolase family protein [Thermoleophilaceae bacterium]|nr:fumarylacetoacetate hydrolase family protein [Thermoleophilaceae bacterium]